MWADAALAFDDLSQTRMNASKHNAPFFFSFSAFAHTFAFASQIKRYPYAESANFLTYGAYT